jgi:hypothetical protein
LQDLSSYVHYDRKAPFFVEYEKRIASLRRLSKERLPNGVSPKNEEQLLNEAYQVILDYRAVFAR